MIQYKYKKTYSLGTRVDPKNAYTDKIDIIPTGQRILIGTQNNNGIGVGFYQYYIMLYITLVVAHIRMPF